MPTSATATFYHHGKADQAYIPIADPSSNYRNRHSSESSIKYPSLIIVINKSPVMLLQQQRGNAVMMPCIRRQGIPQGLPIATFSSLRFKADILGRVHLLRTSGSYTLSQPYDTVAERDKRIDLQRIRAECIREAVDAVTFATCK